MHHQFMPLEAGDCCRPSPRVIGDWRRRRHRDRRYASDASRDQAPIASQGLQLCPRLMDSWASQHPLLVSFVTQIRQGDHRGAMFRLVEYSQLRGGEIDFESAAFSAGAKCTMERHMQPGVNCALYALGLHLAATRNTKSKSAFLDRPYRFVLPIGTCQNVCRNACALESSNTPSRKVRRVKTVVKPRLCPTAHRSTKTRDSVL